MQELGTLMEKAETGFYWKRWCLEKGSVGAWLMLRWNEIFQFYWNINTLESVILVFSLDYTQKDRKL